MKGSLFSRPSSPFHDSHHSSYVSPSSTPSRMQPPTFSETMMDENIDFAEEIIKKWEVDSIKHPKFRSLFEHDRNEARRFLESVSDLQKAMHFYMKLSTNSEKLIQAQNLMQLAVKRLEKEFYTILSSNRKNLDSESVSYRPSLASARSSISDTDEVSDEDDGGASTPDASVVAMEDLKSIADSMIGSGYTRECLNIYKIIRKSIIDETLYYLHVESSSVSLIQKMDWTVLDHKIKNWLHAVKVAVKTLFCGERILCDFVFSSSERIAESCFTEISRDAAVNLFSFPHNFAKSKRILSPEKMFRGLDMYEAISDLWPEIESIFGHESLSVVRSEAVAAQLKLAEAVRLMLNQFEAAIQKDSSNATANGGVHPLTRYVMNFLIFLGDYSGAICDILMDWTVSEQTPLPVSYFSSPTAGSEDPASEAVTARFAWLILVLICKLDGKAVRYADAAQSYLFLANNLNYVVSKIRTSTLGILMGVDWIWKHDAKVKIYVSKYERMGWSKAMTSLQDDPTVEIPERFRRFYVGFEESYRKQSSWVISDPKLRDEVKISLSKKIVGSYRELYLKHRGNYQRGFGAESIVRYAPEDLDNYLSDMFFAATASTSGTARLRSNETSPESSISSRVA
ncbi:exocyst complex component EXO70H1-like [Henckelia pumila]|uniref:exocyst complex component EXO70H1-like n=1 Tax=Henckelia pumila TaxID=405737 RepID=UPI003C6E8554